MQWALAWLLEVSTHEVQVFEWSWSICSQSLSNTGHRHICGLDFKHHLCGHTYSCIGLALFGDQTRMSCHCQQDLNMSPTKYGATATALSFFWGRRLTTRLAVGGQHGALNVLHLDVDERTRLLLPLPLSTRLRVYAWCGLGKKYFSQCARSETYPLISCSNSFGSTSSELMPEHGPNSWLSWSTSCSKRFP